MVDTSTNVFLTEDIGKLFKKFVIPSSIAMLISGIQGIIDGIFVGNFIGVNAMAGVTIASPFLMFFISIGFVLSSGAQSQIGIALGEQNITKGKNAFKTAFLTLVAFGVFITFIALFFSEQVSTMLGANDVLINYSSDYIKAIAIVSVPGLLSFLFGMSTKLINKPHLYLYGSILSIVVNIFLNFVLIYLLDFGTFGAGLATCLAYSSSLFIVTLDFLKKDTIINVFDGKFDLKLLGKIFYNGSSEGISTLSTGIVSLLFNLSLMDLIGEIGVAAFTAISYLSQFGTTLMFGISDGISSIVSYNFGARNFDRVKDILKLALKSSLFIGVIVFLIITFFKSNLISLFVKDDVEVLNLAVEGASIYSFAFLFNGVNIVIAAFFTAIGYAKESAIISVLRGLVFVSISIFVLGNIFLTNGIWMSVPCAEILTFIIALFMINKEFKTMI